eukprot:190793-Rhodomonas_salina.1
MPFASEKGIPNYARGAAANKAFWKQHLRQDDTRHRKCEGLPARCYLVLVLRLASVFVFVIAAMHTTAGHASRNIDTAPKQTANGFRSTGSVEATPLKVKPCSEALHSTRNEPRGKQSKHSQVEAIVSKLLRLRQDTTGPVIYQQGYVPTRRSGTCAPARTSSRNREHF